MFESLEPRRLLVLPIGGSGSGTFIDLDDTPNVAFITTGNDVLEIILSGGNIQVRNGAGVVQDQRSAAGIFGISVNGQGGDDFIRLGRADGTLMPNFPVTVRGGTGNDTVIGGNQADQLFGDDGNDRMDGRAGGDRIEGGVGFDTGDYSYRSVPITVTLANGSANDGSNSGNNSSIAQYNDGGADNLVDIEAVLGGSGADNMTGSTAANWLDGGGGNDTIRGGDGIDTIVGGVNTDLAYGDAQDDYFFFQDATGDQFLGGTGSTIAQFDAGLDTPAPAPPPFSLNAASFSSFLAESFPTGELDLDEAFGEDANGKVLTSIGGVEAIVSDIAIQRVEIAPDEFEEKIIVVGGAFGPSESYDFLVARYNSDGTLDTTFGEDETGIVYTDMTPEGFSDDFARSVAINQDNQIIVAGTVFREAFIDEEIQYSSMALAKYDADGDLDDLFGSEDDGRQIYEPDFALSLDSAARVEIQYVFNGDTTVEEYVIAGTIGPVIAFTDLEPEDTTYDFGLIRAYYNGSLDTGFGDSGLVTTDYFANNDFGTGLAIDPEENNIWISGYTTNGSNSDFLVAGYDVDGAPLSGALLKYNFGSEDLAYDSVISGSRLIVVGESGFDGFTNGVLLAVNIADTDFPAQGEAVGNWYISEDGSVSLRAVTLDDAGQAVAVGSFNEEQFYVYRFDPNFLSPIGDPVKVEFESDEEPVAIATGVVVQEDGKIVVSGLFDDPFIALARLTEHVEEPPFVDEVLSPEDVQNFHFLIGGNPDDPVPADLVERLTALKPDGTLEINGTSRPDNICVTEEGGIITVNRNGELLQYSAALVTKIILRGLDGNDYICVDCDVTLPVYVDGGKGNDTVIGGGGDDELHGGAGNDSLDGGCHGDDKVYGEADKDTVRGGDGNDTVSGGDGDDSADGGDGNDTVTGDAGKDTVKGGNGNDDASGGIGDDLVEGGSGNDRLNGDSGKDTVKGGNDDDQVFGGTGNDSLYGDSGRDILIGGLDADRLDGGSADDILDGGTTIYDTNTVAMAAILAEWTRPDLSYNSRCNNIINGGGLNGAFKFDATTVHSSPVPADTLTGGSNNDLFYLASSGDVATDRLASERRVTVHG